ncbi:ATP-grasp domain-containing protein [Gracilibacillus phocaeensis]|uniref:ATP-grasp domain-containing protein n=1 Tax=Gracilibacillus phocaeensis TaxID=2042304 RepID=UPI001030602F|nr:ATP-grasp domain-containing protein [Gracilibacillus phocaeensis]
MERTYMILGGSYGQVPAIKTAKRLGLKTLVIDQNPNAVGFEFADYAECVDTTDLENALKVAKKYNVCGSMTISSDIAVPTSCYINETLELSNQGIGIAEKVTDKALMRDEFKTNGITSPNFFIYEENQDLSLFLLKIKQFIDTNIVIVKPSDSSGSRGVTRINDELELRTAIQNAMQYSRNRKVVVEEYISGIEVGAQCFSIDGEMVYCFIHNDTVSSNMVPVGHSFPSYEKTLVLNKIEEECAKALKALGVVNGPSNIDIIIDKNDRPYIIEIGARIGATKLPELVKFHSGIDIIESAIKLSTGIRVKVENKVDVPVAVEMLYFERNGEVETIKDFKSLLSRYNIVDYEVKIKKGMQIETLISGVNVYGFVMCKGETVEEAEKNCNDFIRDIKCKIHISEVQ